MQLHAACCVTTAYYIEYMYTSESHWKLLRWESIDILSLFFSVYGSCSCILNSLTTCKQKIANRNSNRSDCSEMTFYAAAYASYQSTQLRLSIQSYVSELKKMSRKVGEEGRPRFHPNSTCTVTCYHKTMQHCVRF